MLMKTLLAAIYNDTPFLCESFVTNLLLFEYHQQQQQQMLVS